MTRIGDGKVARLTRKNTILENLLNCHGSLNQLEELLPQLLNGNGKTMIKVYEGDIHSIATVDDYEGTVVYESENLDDCVRYFREHEDDAVTAGYILRIGEA